MNLNRYYNIHTVLFAVMLLSFFGVGRAQTTGETILSVESTSVRSGHASELSINLRNSTDIVAFQFTLQLPKGVSVTGKPLCSSSRMPNHEVAAREVATGNYMVVCHSASNAIIEGNNGQVLSIPISIANSVKEGEELPITLKDVIVSDVNSNNVLTGIQNGTLKISKSPDLIPSNVSAGKTTLHPGEDMDLSWIVTNSGENATEGGWQEEIYLISSDGNRKKIATAFNSDILNKGESMARMAHIILGQVPGIDGECHIEIKLIPEPNCGEPSYLRTNNSAVSESSVRIGKELYLNPSSIKVTEGSTYGGRIKITRSGSAEKALTLTLTHNLDNRFTLPESITIPQGHTSAELEIKCNGNNLADSENMFHLAIGDGEEGYEAQTATIEVNDDTDPTLTLQCNTDIINEGESIEVKLVSDITPKEDINVKLQCDYPARLKYPDYVTIPAGTTEVSFLIENPDNDKAEGDAEAELLPAASGYKSSGLLLTINDNDIPVLKLELSHNGLSEDAGALSANATVTREGNLKESLTIEFSSDAPDQIFFYPEKVTIPAGEASATCMFGPIDNTLADGDRTYNISAYVLLSSCSCAISDDSKAGRVSVPFEVYDNDGARLSLGLSGSSVKEGNTFSLTVVRNTPTDNELPLTIAASPEGLLSIPTNLAIPAGEKSAFIHITALRNQTMSDSKEMTLAVEAEGHSKGVTKVVITDNTLPDARIDSFKTDTDTSAANEEITARLSVANTGTGILPATTKVSFYWGNSASAFHEFFIPSTIAAGATETFAVPLKVPSVAGNYTLRAVVNPDKTISELLYDNNSRTSGIIKVTAPFTASVATDKAVYLPGEDITISGNLSGKYMEGDSVEIIVSNNGYRQTLKATTDASGNFMTVYKPYALQYGHFDISASHPGDPAATTSASFDIPMLERTSYNNITVDVTAGDSAEGAIELVNNSGIAIENITIDPKSKEGIEMSVDADSDNVAGGGHLKLRYKLHSDRTSPTKQWEVLGINLKGSNCPETTVPIYFYSRKATGDLASNIQNLNTTVAKGMTKSMELKITNNGAGESGEISFSIPNWMTVTPSRVSSLKNGESASVNISFDAPEKVGGRHTGIFYVNGSNASALGIPFSIEAVASGNGTLTVDVCDNYTYAHQTSEAEGPHVEGAEIKVVSRISGKTISTGKSGTDGLWSAELPEGPYSLSVTAEGHKKGEWDLNIDAERTTKKTANILIDAVKFDYEVVETEIEDEYEIETTVTYETNVPMPVVKITQLDSFNGDDMLPGESRIVKFELHNVGLMRTESVNFYFGEAKGWTIKSLIDLTAFPLEADESKIIPIMITLNDQNIAQRSPSPARGPLEQMAACMENFMLEYAVICGEDMINNDAVFRFALKTCSSGAIYSAIFGGMTGNTPSNSGGNGAGPSPEPPSPPADPDDDGNNHGSWIEIYTDLETIRENTFCDPEMAALAEAVGDAALALTPTGDIVGPINNAMNTSADYAMAQSNPDDPRWRRALANDMRNNAISMGQLRLSFSRNGRILSRLIDVGRLMLALARLGTHFITNDQHAPAKQSLPSWVTEFQNETKLMAEELFNLDAYQKELLGDTIWTDRSDKEFNDFMEAIRIKEDSTHFSLEEALQAKPSYVTDAQVEALIRRWNNLLDLPNPGSGIINFEYLDSLICIVKENESEAAFAGYTSALERYNAARERYEGLLDLESQSVCASVSLKFTQSLVMTRQAFRGTLTVNNGHKSKAVKNLKFYPNTATTDGFTATSHEFQIELEDATGFVGNLKDANGLDLESMTSGTMTALYIPTRYAAPESDTPWLFGGSVIYTDPFTDSETTMTLPPVCLNVSPSPLLNLDYFMQRDVFGDDPFTEEVETSKETEFALMITNNGEGTAKNIRMTTKKPEIVDNRKGLAVDFNLTGGAVAGEQRILPMDGNITNDLGNINASDSKVIQWWFESDLLGHFTEYDVTVNHLTSYGNPDLSLIGEAYVHELIHSLRNPATDKIVFLANDIEDANNTPDKVWSSGRTSYDVNPATGFLEMKSDEEGILTINSVSDGWIYGSIKDPTYGTREIASITRNSDGAEINPKNFWQTDRTLRDGLDPLYENRLHFADSVSGGQTCYTLHFTPVRQSAIRVVQFLNIPTDGIAEETVTKIGIQFNQAIDHGNLGGGAINLTHNGESIDSTLLEFTATDLSSVDVDLSNALAEILKNAGSCDGIYTLAVNTGLMQTGHNNMDNSLFSATWSVLDSHNVAIKAIPSPEEGGIIDPALKTVAFGEDITFKAIPNEGWKFIGWELNGENCGVDETFTITVLTNDSIVAKFQLKNFKVTVDSPEGGKIESAKGFLPYGTKVDFVAIADPGYEFEKWIVNGTVINECLSDTITLTIDKDITIGCVFRQTVFTHYFLLQPGWSWISSYFRETEIPTNRFNEVLFDPQLKDNSDKTLKLGNMIKVKTLLPTAFCLTGSKSTSSHQIELKAGGNWIGAINENSVGMDDAFSGMTDGDIVAGQEGFSEFCNGVWEGNLSSINPAEGYIYFTQMPKVLTMNTGDGFEPGWTFIPGYASLSHKAMHLTFKLESRDGNELVNEGQMTITALDDNDEVCGDAICYDGIWRMNIFSDTTEHIRLKITDTENNEEYTNLTTIRFNEGVSGSRKSPVKVVIGDYSSVDEFIYNAEKVTVTTPSGLILMKDSDPTSLKNLDKGLYIINGRTCLIR